MSPRLGSRARHGDRPALRDQSESAFASILGRLVDRVAGARGAALVDSEGETVDYAGQAPPFDTRLAAAHLRIVLREGDAQTQLAPLRWLVVRASRKRYVIHALPDGYALVVLLTKAAAFAGWHRALATCARALGLEAGWPVSAVADVEWFPVQVVSDARHRPRGLRLAGRVERVEILGALVRRPPRGSAQGRATPPDFFAGTMHLAPLERGWRVRLSTGLEATLVREPGGVWYSDEPLEEPP